jgi:hypothetical protein
MFGLWILNYESPKIIGFEGYLMMSNMMFEICIYHVVSFIEFFY